MQSQTYTDRSNCARAARRQFGKNAKQGVDFVLVPEGGKFRFVANNEKAEANIPAAEGGARLTPAQMAPMPADKIPANTPGNNLIAATVDGPLPQGATIDANGGAHAPEKHPLEHMVGHIGIKSTYRTAEAAAIAALGKGARVGTDFFIKKTARGGYVWKSRAYVEAEKELEMSKRKESTTKPGASKARGKVAGKTEAAGQPRVRKDYADALASAEKGVLPKAPDFTAETHARFRPRLDELKKLVKAADVKALKAYPIDPVSSSRKMLDRYRNLAVVALEARAKGGAATKH